jgi:anti-anti-sigma factor
MTATSQHLLENSFGHPRGTPPSGRTVVRLRGALDIDAAPALRERLIGVLHRGAGLLVLDLSWVSSCDMSGLAVLIGTQRRARLLGRQVHLAAPNPAVAKMLRSTGLDRSFTIYSDLAGALASELASSHSLSPPDAGSRPPSFALSATGTSRPGHLLP